MCDPRPMYAVRLRFPTCSQGARGATDLQSSGAAPRHTCSTRSMLLVTVLVLWLAGSPVTVAAFEKGSQVGRRAGGARAV